ncbi:MAG TPA: DUF2752 domain-containing protein [Thermoanaerobaculia bacterium]|nr:DUF2752 domain-containing protein [Thermoanaerobaculia bacterium]
MKRSVALRAASLSAVIAAGAWVVYTYAPTEHGFYPRCIFKLATGLDCPGCGSTRALHQLLHGNVEAAFRLNPMLFVMLAVALCALPGILRGRPPRFLQQPWFAYSALIVLGTYWIFRNTPLYPF